MRNKIIAITGLALLLIIFLWFNLFKTEPASEVITEPVSTIPAEDPMDVTVDFYNNWLDASLSTTTNPKDSGLRENPVLSAEVRKYINDTDTTPLANNLEPVLCQPTLPERIGGKTIYKQDMAAQVQILARGGETKSPYQALVDLKAIEGKWQISQISCTQGETAPVREFNFEQEGYLLKSVPPPLDSKYWHLVYEIRGEKGHTVPLFIDDKTICISLDKSESICNPNSFIEPALVFVQADMLESGAVVKKLHFK